MKRILLTNDDGIHAEGLQIAAKALAEVGEVTVIAPASEQSATSHSITLARPLRLKPKGTRRYWLDGSPTDCVFIAHEVVMADAPPDLIVSGINAGGNLGMDVTYSGTVGAAMEGALRGIPSIAISQVGRHDLSFELAGRFLAPLASRVLSEGLPANTMLNVNVPKRPREPHGYRFTKLGRHGYADVVDHLRDPRGRQIYWIGGRWAGFEPIEGSDCVAIGEGLISVTPLRLDLCPEDELAALRRWSMDGFAAADA